MQGPEDERSERMKDQFERNINYMRISLTDRCNLRCRFCMPAEPDGFFTQEELLKEQELLQIIASAAELGVTDFRLTGGEPLLWEGIERLISFIRSIRGVEHVYLTTNGILLEKKLTGLTEAGLSGVNISLCSTDREEYYKITGYDGCETVLSAIEAAAGSGLITKVNCVPMPGENTGHLKEIAGLAREKEVDVRFIEMMPVGKGAEYSGLSNRELLKMLSVWFGPSETVAERKGMGPAVYRQFPGFQGKIGLIGAYSCSYCENCNRVRLMADGFLKLCLDSGQGINLRELLRSGCTGQELRARIQKAVWEKPERHRFPEKNREKAQDGKQCMSQIGG